MAARLRISSRMVHSPVVATGARTLVANRCAVWRMPATASIPSTIPNHINKAYLPRTFSTTPTNMGVEIQNIAAGDGKNFPKPGDTVAIHYTGTLDDGSKFDSSRDRGQPFETKIGVGRVIKGWDEGVPQLSIGQKANLICSPDYAYGPNGMPPVIPKNATLKFEVELIAINGKTA